MYQMFEDSRGDLWVSLQPSKAENFGLYRLQQGEQNFYRFTKEQGLPDGKSASCFAEDKHGNLWFGFYEGGLVRFANGRFDLFTAKDGLPGGVILDLLSDSQGRLWIASTNGGVGHVDDPSASKPAFAALTTKEGLTSNNIRTLVEDKAGNIYVGTVRGVDRLSPDTTRIRHFSINDGRYLCACDLRRDHRAALAHDAPGQERRHRGYGESRREHSSHDPLPFPK